MFALLREAACINPNQVVRTAIVMARVFFALMVLLDLFGIRKSIERQAQARQTRLHIRWHSQRYWNRSFQRKARRWH